MAKAKPPESVTITYDLHDLPTAQHRAGLAGLLLQIESMKKRNLAPPTWKYDEIEPTSKVHVEFTEATTAALFNDLYDAAWVEGPPKEKPFTKGKGENKKEIPPVRIATITKVDTKGVEKTVPGYVYNELTPALATLNQYLPKDGGWVRLWRDLIWQVVRDSKKKAPYIQRAAAKKPPAGAVLDADPGAADDEDDDEKGKADGSTWADLVKHHTAVSKNTFAVGKLSSALLLGAQSVNAEVIPFAGRLDQTLLLHFWPLTCMVYIPRFVDADGQSHIGRRDKNDKSKHFCLAVPDVADLPAFIEAYPLLLAALGTKVAGFRPRESLIDLPAEGGLSFVAHLARLVPQVAGASARSFVSGVDYLHLQQDGNIVRARATGRVAYRNLAEDYFDIVGREGEKPGYSSPLFRRGLMQALLDDKPWFRPFAKELGEWKSVHFIPAVHPATPFGFWANARKKFAKLEVKMKDATPAAEPDPDELLATTVRRLVRRYMDFRLKKDGDHDFPAYRKARATPPKAAEERRKLAEKLFLEFRSRRDQAFKGYFGETFFRSDQYMGHKPVPKLFERTAKALFDRTDDVKTLTLMALSAESYTPTQKEAAS